MKKLFALLLALVMTLSLVACGGSSSSSGSSDSSSSSSSSGDAEVEPKVLRLSSHLGMTDVTMFGLAEPFSKALAEVSGGALTLELYPDSQLGGQTDNCEGLVAGSIDMTIIDTGTLGNYYAGGGLLDMPYLFSSRDQALKVIEGEVGQQYMDLVASNCGIRPLGIQAHEFRNTLLKDIEIHTMADFKGVKVRIPENPSIESCFAAIGATPVAIPSGEAYTSVQTGVVDGLEGHQGYVPVMKFYEVANVYNLTQHVMTFTALCVSNATWDALSADEQAWIMEAYQQAYDNDFKTACETYFSDGLQTLLDNGVRLVETDKTELMAACAPVLEEFVEKNGLQDIYEGIKALA